MSKEHTPANISLFIKEDLHKLMLKVDTPCTTDKVSKVICALNFAVRIYWKCHRLHTVIESARSEIKQWISDLNDLVNLTKNLVRNVHRAVGS